MWTIFKRRTKRRKGYTQWDLSDPVLQWEPGETWTIGSACQGTQIFGSTGAGKSSGPIRLLSEAFIKSQWGGIFFVAKKDDAATYKKYVADAGRLDDLLVFSPDMLLKYNFIDAEMTQSDGTGLAEGLTALLMMVAGLADRGQGEVRETEPFFRLEATRLLRNAILSLVLANEPVTVPNIHRLIVSAATSVEQVRSEAWQRESYLYRVMVAADRAPKTESQRKDFALASSHLLREWPGLASKTRSSCQATLTATTDILSRGAARDLLSSPTTNVTPQMCHDGAIVIVDFPTLVYHDVGRLIQVIIKYCWQRAHGRRDVSRNPRPTFMIADESHLLAVDTDPTFQTTARSSRTAVVYATQSISNYLEVFGERSEPKVSSLTGNLQTQIHMQQSDVKTIAYAQELLGRRRHLMMNGNQSSEDWLAPLLGMGSRGSSAGFSETYEHDLQASDFNRLAKGGPPRWQCDAILYEGGKTFASTGRTWMPVRFKQKH